MISILPYLELESLYDAYDFNAYNEGLPNRQVRETPVGTYVCPSDVAPAELRVPAAGPANAFQLNVPYMPGSYRAVTGRSDGQRFLDSGEFATYPARWRGPIHSVGVRGFKTERLDDVDDGASNTLLVGESTTKTNLDWRTFWAYSYAHFSLSAVTPQPRTLLGDFDRCVEAGGDGRKKPCQRGWGGFHSGGLHFLLCDGSTHFLATSIDMELFAQLATISGREPARLPR